MSYQLQDLIDIDQFQSIQDKLNMIYSFPSAIVDNDGNILTATAWQEVCTQFHRTHPECEKECKLSDRYIVEHIDEANPAVSYTCPHGLVDNATPIIIEGVHYGNFFTGQFFLEPPDLDFFRKQAKRYGFDEVAYLEAVKKVPVWSKEQLNNYLFFIKGLIEIISSIALKNLKEIEAGQRIVESQRALQRSEESLRIITSNTPDHIIVHDNDLIYTLVINPQLGLEEKDIIGKTDFDILHTKEAHEITRIKRKVLKTGKPYHYETSLVNKANELEYFDGSFIPKFDSDGKVDGLIGYFHNVTEKKRSEMELIEAKNRAEESDHLKSAFLANMSHEIRTPMNGILGFTELLKENNLSAEERQYYIEIIESSGARLLNLINDIIDISKVESGQLEVTLSVTNVNWNVGEIYKFFKPEAAKIGVDLSYQMGLPDTVASVMTDKDKLYAILTNLVKNALKYTRKGQIEIGYLKKDKCLKFFVKDSGIGITPENQRVIFDRFRQAGELLTRQQEGAGLGLSISKAFVEMLGGEIWVESEEGVGSQFYFTIPYTPVESASVDKTIRESEFQKNR